MRKIIKIKKNRSLKAILHNLLNIFFLKLMPNYVFRKILNYRFINFGMEITNICMQIALFAHIDINKKKGCHYER